MRHSKEGITKIKVGRSLKTSDSLQTISELEHNQKRTTQLKTWVLASCNSTDKLLPPLLTRFRDIHFKPHTEEKFVEIVIDVLDRQEGVDRDIALLIADGVYNRLKNSNIREYVRIARLARNDSTQVNRIIDTFAKYGAMTRAG